MPKVDPLDAYIMQRAATRPAERLIPEQSAKLAAAAERSKQVAQQPPVQQVERERVATRKEAELKPPGFGTQPTMGGPGIKFVNPRAHKQQAPQQAAPVVKAEPVQARKVDPLDAYIAARPKRDVERPMEKLHKSMSM